MITEGSVKVKVVWSGYTNFQLILSSIVSNDFPVMNSTRESKCCSDWSENVSLLFQEDETFIILKRNACPTFGAVPLKFAYTSLWFFRQILYDFWLEFQQDLVHLGCVIVCVNEFKKKLTSLWAAGFCEFVLGIFELQAVLLVPASGSTAVFFMCFEITHANNFTAPLALDLEPIVNSFEGSTGHEYNIVTAAIGAVSKW